METFRLREIKDFLQELINTVSPLINAEIAIVDTAFIVLAGTKKYHNLIDKRAVPNIYRVLFKKKEILVIENPMEHEICSKCYKKERCSEFAGINTPLLLDKRIIGGMSISALDPEQKRFLIKCKKNYIDFSKKMAELIQSKIKNYVLTKKLDLTTRQLDSIINYSNEGIILMNSERKIRVINDYCCKMFKITKDDVLNKSFSDIFKNKSINDMIYLGREFDAVEASIQVFENTYRIVHSGKPIRIDENLKGFLWFLRDIKSINALVSRFTTSKEDITFNEIVGESIELQQVKNKACSVAGSNSTILIQGESGTGKELFARAIHNSSPRKHKPFISINCGAIPENLIESELFGYEGGAFTGARQKGKPGKFELANGGTLFLDEIGDMPLHLQVKLLRALEEQKISRLGGIEDIKIDVRIIAATNKDLESMVEEKGFRKDLFYRLNVIPLRIPPLRERGKGDIEILANFFIKKYSKILNKFIKGISDDAMKLLKEYMWPGNIRELENTIEYGINVDNDGIITAEDLPKKFRDGFNRRQTIMPVEEVIKKEVEKAVKFYGNTVDGKKKAASALGIGIATLYRWLNKYKLS
jgi:PAS domain S-box-containing protein